MTRFSEVLDKISSQKNARVLAKLDLERFLENMMVSVKGEIEHNGCSIEMSGPELMPDNKYLNVRIMINFPKDLIKEAKLYTIMIGTSRDGYTVGLNGTMYPRAVGNEIEAAEALFSLIKDTVNYSD